MNIHLTLLIIFLYPVFVICIEPGPKFKPTKGEVWPAAQHETKSDACYKIEFENLNITKPYHTCDILEKGIKRLLRQNLVRKQSLLNSNEQRYMLINEQTQHVSKVTFIDTKIEFSIELMKQCEEYPHFEMTEAYTLSVGETIKLSSPSVWGILRGMETFNQLIYFSDDYTELRINATYIEDYPAYPYRGLLIDTGRHYLEPNTIHMLIDAMEMNKMNVLHWHIVDDQSFPYQSNKFPTLSKMGAFHPTMIYTKEDIQQIIEHGRLTGIRVIPEFDVPGHVRSWGEAFPEILTKCYKGKNISGLGPLDPINNATYAFVKELYEEVCQLFPDSYVHLGGDEVDIRCWSSNPKLQAYMKKHHIKNVNKLHAQFMTKVKTLLPPRAQFILWQDVFDAGVPLPKKTLLQVWRYQWITEMDNILKAGHRVIFSSSWYLDEINAPWEQYYRADPRQMVYLKRLNDSGLNDIVGGEACMWGEKVDDTNIFTRIWPRASAVAERLWTGMNYTILPPDPVTNRARSRIEEHTCRMRINGIPAEPPSGPGFCFGAVPDSQFRSRARNHHIHLNRIGRFYSKKYSSFWHHF